MTQSDQKQAIRLDARAKKALADKIRDFGEVSDLAGCPPDQQINFIKAGIWLQPKQLEMSAAARACDHRCPACEQKRISGKPLPQECTECGPTAIGVGGARGGGKTAWMFAQVCLDDCQRYPGLKFLFIRKTLTSAREQIRDLLKKTCARIEYNYKEQAGIVEFPNGSYVLIKHFKDEKDIDNFLGNEYDGIAAEELTTFSFDKWKNLMTCLRSSKPNWRPRFYAAWNWGGAGHFWVKKVFYDPWKTSAQRETRYILARVDDNSFNNPEYINTLRSLTGWKYQSWFLGNPDFQAGQFFTNWNEPEHVFPNRLVNFDIHKAQSWFGNYDYGFGHPSCFHLQCRDNLGNTYCIDEWHQAEAVIQEQAEFIKDVCRRHGVEIHQLDYIAAGKDCFNRQKDGRTIADEFQDNEIRLEPVAIDRVNAWAVMQQRLGNVEKGVRPTWFIHQRCKNLITQIPMAQHHETRIGDVAKMNADADGEGGDDALESARNGLVAEPHGAITVCGMVPIGGYQPIYLELTR